MRKEWISSRITDPFKPSFLQLSEERHRISFPVSRLRMMLRESTTSSIFDNFGDASTDCRTIRYMVRAWSRSFAARNTSWAGAWHVRMYWASWLMSELLRFFFGTKIPARRNRSRPSGRRQPNSGRRTLSACHSMRSIRAGSPPRSSGWRQSVWMNSTGASAEAASHW